ncbi:tastin [Ictalurus punctatus]|uniref:Tastin n=1 Tax=Ictalurus punctatus TaxID=7998 RepID=A0A2D0SKF0_ICTPU|nr:tastin [Ictalurus punctatus]
MASSPTALHPQNTSQKEHVRILKHQALNKVPENSRAKPYTAQSSKRGAENKDPNEPAKPTKGVNKLKGVSRLPVLAKSQAVTDISSNPSHRRWEERALLGKAQKRKTCTKPVPFSLSQPQTRNQKGTGASSEPATEPGNPTTHLTRHTSVKTPSVSQHRTKTGAATQNIASGATYTEHANDAVTNSVYLSTEIHTTTAFKLNNPDDIASVVQKDLSTKLGNITLAHSEFTQEERFSSKDQADCRPSTKVWKQTLLSADCRTGESGGVGNAVASCRTPRVSKCPSGPGSNVYLPQRVSVKKKGCHGAEAISENTVPFSPDPSALRSILLNEGIKVGDPGGATPRASTCPSGRCTSIYSAQRVPIRKPQTHAVASVGEPAGGAVTFSPDPSALRSILLNEGVKQGAVMTPRACPSGRATSIYSAQRVPVKKAPVEASTAGTVSFSPDPSALRSILHNEGVKAGSSGVTTPRVSVCPSRRATSIYTAQRVPVKKARAEEAAHSGISKRTPQRVPASQSQSVKRINATHKTRLLNISPGFGETQAPSTVGFSQQEEEVVQRLFQEEPEHEENEQMEDGGDEVTLGQSLQLHHSAEQKLEHEGETGAETNRCHSGKEKIPVAQPFIQAPHRQSVIVFSSGQKLLAQNGAQTASLQTSQHAAQFQPCTDQTSRSQSELNSETDRPVTPGKLCKTKASSFSSAMRALRRRLPPLEEMFLDEECAMYTSRQQSWPTRPRCYNPVALTLLFQDSTRFVPIIVTCPSPGPVPNLSSPIRA